MDSNPLFTLGLGLTVPWRVVDQRFETDTAPHELHLLVAAEPGAEFPCPKCGALAKAHDWKDETWQHLNFFQHACFVTARVPRVRCREHGVLRINVPWARPGSGFTLLFEQAALSFAREMPVATAARLMGITDQRLWRIVEHYVSRAVERLDLSQVTAIALDETAAKRGQTYGSVQDTCRKGSQGPDVTLPARIVLKAAIFRSFIAATAMTRSGFLWEGTFLSRKESLLGREPSNCRSLITNDVFGHRVVPFLDTDLVAHFYTYLGWTRF